MDGQIYTASNSREFEGYKLYQIAEPNHMIGTMVRPYQVGLRYVDAKTNNGGVKRIKEIIEKMVQHVSKFGLYRWITCLNL